MFLYIVEHFVTTSDNETKPDTQDIKYTLYTHSHLVVVVHAGEVSPAFVASDFDKTLKKTDNISKSDRRHTIYCKNNAD